MTPGALNTTVEWPTSRTSLLFLFNSPSPQSSCLKTNKQNTATSWAAFTFCSFRAFPGDNYLASCPYACALCVYMVCLRVCWLPTHNWSSLNEPQIMMATKTRQAGSDWEASRPVMIQSAAEELWGLAVLRHGEVLLLGSSDLWERELSRLFWVLHRVSWTDM